MDTSLKVNIYIDISSITIFMQVAWLGWSGQQNYHIFKKGFYSRGETEENAQGKLVTV